MNTETGQEQYPVYLKYGFRLVSKDPEVLVAELVSLGFESFEEHEHALDAYIREDQVTDAIRNALSEMKGTSYDKLSIERIPHQNWNAQWESSFKPILIGNFCGVRATFHASLEGVRHELVIDPKMAFGTGHHETTWMMISAMESLDMEGKKVLDYGAGTGILAILAEQSGACHIDALEIDFQAVENMQLNLELNRSKSVTGIHGDISEVSNNRYDIILANINRNVILASLEQLFKMLDAGGKILFSGILESDRDLVTKKITQSGFQIKQIQGKGEWICLMADK